MLKSDEMSILLVKIESVINCRPLTFVYDDVDGISFTLLQHTWFMDAESIWLQTVSIMRSE